MFRSLFYALLLSAVADSQVDRFKSNVLELSEKFLEVKEDGHWFVEFYAPWCGHCKKLHPTWERVASFLAEKASRIQTGRIDCTRFTEVANKLSIHGFPTIKYFRDGEEFTYEGDRNREALIEYALKLEGPEVRQIPSHEIFMRLYNEHYVRGGLFVLVSNAGEDNELKQKFAATAKDMFSKVYFAEMIPEYLPSNITIPHVPAVLTFKDSNYYVYDPEQHSESLKSWIQAERWPLMPLLTYGNLYEIGLCCNKLLVMVVSDLVERTKNNSPVKRFHDLAKEMAKANYVDLHKHFQFVWTDGNELATSILLKNAAPPDLLVFNVSSYEYYISQDPVEHMTKESLALFLKSVINGEIHAYGGKGIIQRIKRAVYEAYSAIYGMFATQPLLSCCLFGLPLGVLSIICYTLCSTDSSVDRDEIYKDSDDEDVLAEEEEGDEGEFNNNNNRVNRGQQNNSNYHHQQPDSAGGLSGDHQLLYPTPRRQQSPTVGDRRTSPTVVVAADRRTAATNPFQQPVVYNNNDHDKND